MTKTIKIESIDYHTKMFANCPKFKHIDDCHDFRNNLGNNIKNNIDNCKFYGVFKFCLHSAYSTMIVTKLMKHFKKKCYDL